jgi:hypothetical protein
MSRGVFRMIGHCPTSGPLRNFRHGTHRTDDGSVRFRVLGQSGSVHTDRRSTSDSQFNAFHDIAYFSIACSQRHLLPARRTRNPPRSTPERLPREKLEQIKVELGSYGYDTQYQQQPRGRDGTQFFSTSQFLVDGLPLEAPRGVRRGLRGHRLRDQDQSPTLARAQKIAGSV